jgi:hypothetical protein
MPTARTLGSGHSIAVLAGSSTGHNFRLTLVRCTGWLSSLPPTPLRRGCLHDSCQLPPAFVRKGVAEQWTIEEPPGERDGIALFQPSSLASIERGHGGLRRSSRCRMKSEPKST